MRTAFLIGALLGLAVVAAAARYVPWVDPPRLPSHTTVVSNGGRAETFVIRLPADRILAAGGAGTGIRGAVYPGGVELPERLAAGALLVEQFKLRDRNDDVIGVAARHWSPAAGAAWLLVIPGRGAMLLAGDAEPARAIDTALSSAGRRAGQAWSGQASVTLQRPESSGRLHGGTDEFAELAGTYSETWTVTGATASGELRGTIELHTVAARLADGEANDR